MTVSEFDEICDNLLHEFNWFSQTVLYEAHTYKNFELLETKTTASQKCSRCEPKEMSS